MTKVYLTQISSHLWQKFVNIYKSLRILTITPKHKLTMNNCNSGSGCHTLFFVRQHAIASYASVIVIAARWIRGIDHFYCSAFKRRYRCTIW